MDSKYNYVVVLFKNKERKKIINKFVTKNRCYEFYNEMIKNTFRFEKVVENGEHCNFELAILKRGNLDSFFVKDDFGRNVKVDLDDDEFSIVKIKDFSIEEFIYDQQKLKKISFDAFIKNYLPKKVVKLVSKLNNKVIVQNDNTFNIFTLKNDFDCDRFLNVLQDYMIVNKRLDCIIVRDSSNNQKKYLYELLSKNGFSKSSLYRKSTTFTKDG